MSQKYTEVEWTDETSTEPGTLINKARLDQMQSAHHYADGFEEVDAVPSADPGVDYHKVVFCTADSTFYRWDGAQWTKDIDDETKALLLAHEADHANPHQVTKAQVGLGDVVDKGMDDAPTDSSDNYVKSGGVKTALDGKLDIVPTTSGTYFYAQQSTGPTRYPGSTNASTPTTNVVLRESNGRISCTDPVAANNAANKNYVDGRLTDGSVTKVGTADVGGDLKPIKLVAGVPTAVTNDLVDTATAQTIAGTKTFTDDPVIQGSIPRLAIRNTGDVRGTTPADTKFSGVEFRDKNDAVGGQVSTTHNATGLRKTFLEAIGQDGSTAQLGLYNEADGTKYMAGPARMYDPSNTSDIVTIGSLQASTDVVHPLSTVGKYAYTHDGSTQGETALVDGTTANTIPIRDGNGRMQAADPASGATDKTLVTANWVSQTGDSAPNNLVHRSGNESISGYKQFITARANNGTRDYTSPYTNHGLQIAILKVTPNHRVIIEAVCTRGKIISIDIIDIGSDYSLTVTRNYIVGSNSLYTYSIREKDGEYYLVIANPYHNAGVLRTMSYSDFYGLNIYNPMLGIEADDWTVVTSE